MRLYDRLFSTAQPGGESGDFLLDLNADSVKVIRAQLEPSLRDAAPEQSFQFERHGYFVADRVDYEAGRAGVQPHRHTEGFVGQGREVTPS